MKFTTHYLQIISRKRYNILGLVCLYVQFQFEINSSYWISLSFWKHPLLTFFQCIVFDKYVTFVLLFYISYIVVRSLLLRNFFGASNSSARISGLTVTLSQPAYCQVFILHYIDNILGTNLKERIVNALSFNIDRFGRNEN